MYKNKSTWQRNFILMVVAIVALTIAQFAQNSHSQPQVIDKNYQIVDLKKIPNSRLTDRDPKLAAIKAFGDRESAQPEGIKSETLEVLYPSAGNAIVTMITDGLADDSVRARKYRIKMQLINILWKITWAGTQVKCYEGRGHREWSKQPCV
jgi:hypothetical protein